MTSGILQTIQEKLTLKALRDFANNLPDPTYFHRRDACSCPIATFINDKLKPRSSVEVIEVGTYKIYIYRSSYKGGESIENPPWVQRVIGAIDDPCKSDHISKTELVAILETEKED